MGGRDCLNGGVVWCGVIPFAYIYIGIPEHASRLQLKTTSGSGAAYTDPYRLYNLDVFEYELDEPMALYGAIPLIISHTKEVTAGLFYFNPTETFVDVQSSVRREGRVVVVVVVVVVVSPTQVNGAESFPADLNSLVSVIIC